MPVFNYHLVDPDDLPDDAVNIMRPSRWGNPFIIGRDGDRATVLRRHREWLWDEIAAGRVTAEDLAVLHEKALLCCCSPAPCHGDTLLRAAHWAAGEIAKAGRF
jgi:hypothetical protein